MSDVKDLLDEAVGSLKPRADQRAVEERVERRKQRRRVAAGSVAVAVFVLAGWFAWTAFRPGGTTAGSTGSDGERIAFTTQGPSDLTSAIAVMAPDGSNVLVLGQGQEPAWSPDGEQIAFSQRTDDGPASTGIFVMRADGTDVRRLTTNPSGDDEQPAWTPDGTTLVFSRSTFVSLTPDPVASRSHRDLYTVAADGTGLTKLIGGPTDDFAPEWSPDGSRVAFLRIVDPASDGSEGIPQIWLASSDGSEPTQLTRLEQGPYRFDWSPDGSAFALDAGCAITIVNDVGQIQSDVALRRDIGCAFDPVWSPDGARLAFAAGTDDDHDIYETDLDGTEVTRLTGPPGSDASPAWWGSGPTTTSSSADNAAVIVPDVVALTSDEARTQLEDLGLTVIVTTAPSREVPEGLVESQDPTPGTAVDAGTTVTIVISEGSASEWPEVFYGGDFTPYVDHVIDLEGVLDPDVVGKKHVVVYGTVQGIPWSLTGFMSTDHSDEPIPVGELFLGRGGRFGGSGLRFSGPQFGVSGTGFGSVGLTAYAGIVGESVAAIEFRPAAGEARPIRLFEGPSTVGARYFVLWPPTGAVGEIVALDGSGQVVDQASLCVSADIPEDSTVGC
jgi:TolB protein